MACLFGASQMKQMEKMERTVTGKKIYAFFLKKTNIIWQQFVGPATSTCFK